MTFQYAELPDLDALIPLAMLLVGIVMGGTVMYVSGIDFTTRNFLIVTGITCLVVSCLANDQQTWLTMLAVLCLGGGASMAMRDQLGGEGSG